MRFTVVGAGAIGGLTGAYLIRNGESVDFVDASPEHVTAMNRDGLLIDGVIDEFRVPAIAYLPEDLTGLLDVVLLAVKSQHTDQAVAAIVPHLADRSLVISLQNGLNPDRIAAQVGVDRVAGGLMNFASDYIESGHIRYGGVGDYYIGRLDGQIDDRIEHIGAKFDRIMNTVPTSNIMGFLWSKQCYGSLLTTTALVDAPVPEVLTVPENREVLAAAVTEAVALADAFGVTLEPFPPFEPELFRSPQDPSEIEAFLDRVAARFAARVKQHTGIWRDLKVRRRKTEVEWLTGEVVRRAEATGRFMPVNAAMVRMIAEIESGSRRQSPDNLLELHALIGQPRQEEE